MKKFISILLLACIFSLAQGQTYSPTGTRWKLIPNQQSDSFQVLKFFKLNGEYFKITSATNGQIIQRENGTWKNKNFSALGYDSLRFYKTTGMLKIFKDGAVALSDTLDGRYALITVLNDSLSHIRSSFPTGIMKIADYDPAHNGGQVVNLSSVQVLYNKSLVSPTIADFTNGQHNHSGTTQGGFVNSDVIVEGSTNRFSPFIYQGGQFYNVAGNFGFGAAPGDFKIDVFGKARIQELTATNNFTFGGVTFTGIQAGSGTNIKLATKNYVDDQIITAGGYNDEQAEDAIGGILDNGTVGDVVFTYNDAGNKISGDIENDSHNHTGATISGLTVANFTSQNVSNWTNDAGYVASSYGLSGALGGTISSPTIANNAVTFPKIQNISSSTLLGRTTSGTGNIESLSVSAVQALLGLGSMAYTSTSAYALSGHNHDATYQPLDGDLTGIAGLTGTTGLLKKTATNTWVLDNTSYWNSSNHPTTLSTYGITDGLSLGSTSTTAAAGNHVHANYVPYTGAASDIDLNGHSITNATNYVLSDERTKQNIKAIRNIDNTPFVQFTFKADSTNKIHYGAIAQEVEKYAPELIYTNKDGTKFINYTELLVLKVARLESENRSTRIINLVYLMSFVVLTFVIAKKDAK